MTELKLSATLLSLIIAVQSARRMFINESHLVGSGFVEQGKNWLDRTQDYFNSFPSDKVHELGLKQNRYCFDAILSFEVTDEMLDTEYDSLAQYSFWY